MLGAADTVDPDLPTLLLEPYTMMDIDVEDSETLSEPSSPPPVLSEPSSPPPALSPTEVEHREVLPSSKVLARAAPVLEPPRQGYMVRNNLAVLQQQDPSATGTGDNARSGPAGLVGAVTMENVKLVQNRTEDVEIVEIVDSPEASVPTSGLTQLMRRDEGLLSLCCERLGLSREVLMTTDFQSMAPGDPLIGRVVAVLCERLAAWQATLGRLPVTDGKVRAAITRLSCLLGLKDELRFQYLSRNNFSVDFLVSKAIQEKFLDITETDRTYFPEPPMAAIATDVLAEVVETSAAGADAVGDEDVIYLEDDRDVDVPVNPKSTSLPQGPQHWLKVQDFARERVSSSDPPASTTSASSSTSSGRRKLPTTPSAPLPPPSGSNLTVARFQQFSRESGYHYSLLGDLARYCIHKSVCKESRDIFCMLFIEGGYHRAQLGPQHFAAFAEMQLEFIPNPVKPTGISLSGQGFSLAVELPANLEDLKRIVLLKVRPSIPYFPFKVQFSSLK